MEIVGAFLVDTLVKDEMLPFFFRRESLATVRAAQGELLAEAVFTR